MIKKTSIFTVLLILAILVGTFARIWKITSLPFPPNGDELAFGYYGWSLLHFGTDEYGNYLPMNFPSIGDYKYPGLAYLNIIPAAIFGLSEITSRFWSVISGIALIPLIYFMILLLFNNRIAAVSASWVIALSPWSITLSRLGYENHLALTLSVAGFTCLLLLKKKQKNQKALYISAIVLLIIAVFTYAAERLFVPLMLLTLLGLSFFSNSPFLIIRKHILTLFIIICTIVLISLIPWQNRGRAEAVMWKQINAGQANRLQELHIEAGISPIKVPVKLTYLFHNKIRISIEDFLYRFANHFSPKFLFFEGEAAIEKIPDMGMLPLILIIFLPLGVLTILNTENKQSAIFILAWTFFAVLPSALTYGEPHINRSSLMIVGLTVLSAFGFIQFLNLFSKTKKIFLISIIFLLFILNSLYALNQLFIQKPVSKPWFSEQVNKQMVKDVFNLKNHYQAVAMPKDEYIYFLFYGEIPPKDFLKQSQIRPVAQKHSWDRVERLGNIYFKMPFDCPKGGKLNVLYICTGSNIPQNSKVLKTIRYLDGLPAYTFIEFIPLSQILTPLPTLPDRLSYMVDIETSPNFPDGIIPDNYPSLW